MAARGPVPKRSSERRRRNKESQVETVAPIIPDEEVAVAIPEADLKWHPIAKGAYESLKQSGQSKLFEPSDWWDAQLTCEMASRLLRQPKGKTSAVMYAAVMSGFSRLLMTEADRRRVRLEIERGGAPEQSAGVTALADYKKRLSAGQKT